MTAAIQFVLVVATASASPASFPSAQAPAAGDRLVPFTLSSRDGKPLEWKPERVTVISFCAYWCDTWKTQVPRLEAARNGLRGLPVDFLSVSVDGRWVEKSVGSLLADPGGAWSSALGIDHVPYTLIVDPQGIIRWSRFGIVRTDDVIREVRSAMERQEGGSIYLTFDDFPSGPIDHDLLDVLRAEDVKATFFVIVSKARSHLDILKRAIKEGHRLAIHCWNHESKDPEITRCQKELESLLDIHVDLVRPPGQESVNGRDGIPLLNPKADPYDYTRPGSQEIIRRTLNLAKNGAIVQFHVGVKDTIKALPELVRRLRLRGFVVQVLD